MFMITAQGTLAKSCKPEYAHKPKMSRHWIQYTKRNTAQAKFIPADVCRATLMSHYARLEHLKAVLDPKSSPEAQLMDFVAWHGGMFGCNSGVFALTALTSWQPFWNKTINTTKMAILWVFPVKCLKSANTTCRNTRVGNFMARISTSGAQLLQFLSPLLSHHELPLPPYSLDRNSP